VLEDRPTAVSDPARPPLEEVHNDNHPTDGKSERRSGGRFESDTVKTVDGSLEGTPQASDDPRR
jgi:hypothetical protein